MIIQGDRGTSDTTSQVLPVNADGTTGTTPLIIADNGGKTEFTYSVYLQDEWELLSEPDAELRPARGRRERLPRRKAALAPGQPGLAADAL